MAQCGDLQPVDHGPTVRTGSGQVAGRRPAPHPHRHHGQPPRTAARQLEAPGRLSQPGGQSTKRTGHTTWETAPREPWGPAYAYFDSAARSRGNLTKRRHRVTSNDALCSVQRRSPMGLEPVGAEAKRALGRGLHRAIGAQSAGGAGPEGRELNHWMRH